MNGRIIINGLSNREEYRVSGVKPRSSSGVSLNLFPIFSLVKVELYNNLTKNQTHMCVFYNSIYINCKPRQKLIYGQNGRVKKTS